MKTKKVLVILISALAIIAIGFAVSLFANWPMDQQTSNAAVAYMTLQKQNKLATRFIETADRYLAENEGSDQLKLVRDQWVGYQMMTASLEGDSELEKEMADKHILLSAEQSSVALKGFETQDVPVMELAGQGSFTGLCAMSFIHEQFHMLSIPQVQESFNNVFTGSISNSGTSDAVDIVDNMMRNQVSMTIRNIAEGSINNQ